METNDRSAATGAHGGEPPKTPKGVRASAGGNSSATRGVNKGGAGTSEPAFLTPWRESQTMAIASSRTPLAHTLKLTQ
jgi:hypothetical protein